MVVTYKYLHTHIGTNHITRDGGHVPPNLNRSLYAKEVRLGRRIYHPVPKRDQRFAPLYVFNINAQVYHVYLASSSLGSRGGYMALTTSSTRGPIRFAAATSSTTISGDWSCSAEVTVELTRRFVSRWTVFKIARQCGARPLCFKICGGL